VEGVAGGQRLPGVSASKALPTGACENDQQCGSDGRQLCDASSTTIHCSCQDGMDFCTTAGQCRLTPAAVCSDCLAAAVPLTGG
jgi:hypothetical protein